MSLIDTIYSSNVAQDVPMIGSMLPIAAAEAKVLGIESRKFALLFVPEKLLFAHIPVSNEQPCCI